MFRRVTTYLFLLAGLCIAGDTIAQPMEVTVRDINAIAQGNVDMLNAGGATLMNTDISPLVQSTLFQQEVVFTAVVLSDPRNSGLSNLTDGQPNRIHIYVRDTSAVTSGAEGMGVQIVDGAYATTGSANLVVGDVIRVTGSPDVFTGSGGNSLQINATAIELQGHYVNDLGLPEDLIDPVVVTTADVNKMIDDNGGVQVNWDNLANLNGQYIRLEDATILTRDISDVRPNWLVSSDGGETVINVYDMSLRYRNDRSDYPDDFNKLDEDFVPPPPGATVNLQGFIVYQGDDPFGRGVPGGALLSMAPFADSDVEVTASPPAISDLTAPDAVPDGSGPVTVSFMATADPARNIASGACIYTTSADETEMTVDATQNGDVWECSLPAQEDGVITQYWARSTDDTGASSDSDPRQYRTLTDGIDSIEDIQMTLGEGPGPSPFDGFEGAAMNITAVVQSDPGTSGFIVLQDNADLDGWSGIFLEEDETMLQRGDSVQITAADVVEDFDVTTLMNATYTVISSGNDSLGYKTVTTDVLQDEAIAEAHEGMMLQFDNVTIMARNADNPDDPEAANFGEWAISSDGTPENQIRVDDASDAIPSDEEAFDGIPAGFNFDTISRWGVYAFHRGVWSYSFGNYKLRPESPADIGELVNVANEDEGVPNRFALDQNYPNPFNPVTTITYSVPATQQVKLQVFDVLGRMVETLVDGVVNSGEYTVDFNAHGLPSGMYLYRLESGDQVTTRKMLLLK